VKDAISDKPVGIRHPIICPHCNEKIDKSLTIVGPKLLIVEGEDERGFFSALFRELDIHDVQIAPVGGKTKIKANLMAISKDSNFARISSIGIIRDADSNPRGSFQSVRDALVAAELPSPKRSLSFVKGPPRVGVMIIPSLKQQGALEDICLQSIADDPAVPCVEEFLDCITEKGLPVTKELSKAKIRVFLSSRVDPTLPLGTAAQKGYWPLGNKAFENICRFLLDL